MQKIIPVLFVTLFAAVLPADIIMKLDMPRTCYMIYEPVTANLALRNTSGQTLVFGNEPEFKGHMEVELSDMHGRPLPGSGTRIDLKGLILRPGINHRIRINLSKWLNLNRTNFYKLRLFIAHPMLKNEYQSNQAMFDVAHGKVLWSRNFGVPQLEGSPSMGKDLPMRTYTLKTLQDKSDVHIFLLVEDKEKIYALKNLGRLLGRETPSCEIDALNQLHILLPVTPKIFHYQVFDWKGNREVERVYRTAQRVPILFRDVNNGSVRVIGGENAQLGVDYVPEKLLPGVPLVNPAAEKQPAEKPAEKAQK